MLIRSDGYIPSSGMEVVERNKLVQAEQLAMRPVRH